MTEYNKNNPLGVASEGVLQNNTPISVASSGYLKEKASEYVGDVDIYLYVSSDISVELSHISIDEPLVVQASSVYEFISAAPVKERGGKSVYSRKKQAQSHIYIWDVPPQSGDPLELHISAECEFVVAAVAAECIYEEVVETIIATELNVYEHGAVVSLKVGVDSKCASSKSLRNLNDEMLVLMFDDLFEDEYVVSMTIDLCGDRRKREDDALLTLMGVI